MLGSAVRLTASASYTANIAKNKHLPHSIELLDYQIESTIKFPQAELLHLSPQLPYTLMEAGPKPKDRGLHEGGGEGGNSHHRT